VHSVNLLLCPLSKPTQEASPAPAKANNATDPSAVPLLATATAGGLCDSRMLPAQQQSEVGSISQPIISLFSSAEYCQEPLQSQHQPQYEDCPPSAALLRASHTIAVHPQQLTAAQHPLPRSHRLGGDVPAVSSALLHLSAPSEVAVVDFAAVGRLQPEGLRYDPVAPSGLSHQGSQMWPTSLALQQDLEFGATLVAPRALQ